MTSNAARRQQAASTRSGATTGGAATGDSSLWKLRDGDGRIAVGWYLFPLRLFLGVTFLFAGLQKLSNPQYFHSANPLSFHAQLIGTAHTSPIGGLLTHLAGASTAIGLLIAVGEIAVGVGALAGLLTRVAAVGGALLALTLFLAVSFRTSPYYTGADIVFLFAWTPLVLAGAGGAPALDTWMARSAVTTAPPAGPGEREDAISRGAVIALVAGGTAVFAGAVAGIGRVLAPAGSTTTAPSLPGPGNTTATTATPTTTPTGGTATPTTAAVPKGTSIGPSSGVPLGGSATFTDPGTGDPSLVIQHTTGTFVAFDAICPHAGCTVAYQQGAKIIACPCHGSEFNPRTGAVVQGPATSGLTSIKVITGSNGDLYVV
jgi:thiosulfate dehydrogenase [quinone] large subunit